MIGYRVDGTLAGHENEIARPHGRRVRTTRFGYTGRRNAFDHSGFFFLGRRTPLEVRCAVLPEPDDLRGRVAFFGFAGGGFGSSKDGCPSTIGCFSSSSSS